jgi:RNA recognition motif-containing protein
MYELEIKGHVTDFGKSVHVPDFNAYSEDDLKEMFSSHGEVKEVKVIEGKGFGFVEMSSPTEAEKAKEALNGSNHKGRTLRVDEARPPKERSFGGGGGGRGGDRGYRRY